MDFEAVSGLALNIRKTSLVPLYQYDEQELRAQVAERAPEWAGVRIEAAAKYLGFFVGPGRATLSWDSPLAKYVERARTWGRLGLGLCLTMQAYRVYVWSVLLFVAQLEDLPPNFSDFELKACRALLPGPRGWISFAV